MDSYCFNTQYAGVFREQVCLWSLEADWWDREQQDTHRRVYTTIGLYRWTLSVNRSCCS